MATGDGRKEEQGAGRVRYRAIVADFALRINRGDLPPEIEEPIIGKFDQTDEPILSLTLSSPTLTQAQLTSIADPGITRELRSIPGVAEVRVVGGAERELMHHAPLLHERHAIAGGFHLAEQV